MAQTSCIAPQALGKLSSSRHAPHRSPVSLRSSLVACGSLKSRLQSNATSADTQQGLKQTSVVPCSQTSNAQLHQIARHSIVCRATDPDKQASNWSVLPSRFNSAYLVILAGYAGLFAFQNPYIFAALTIAFILPQNSTTTSLNSLVILFYESGLFMNFAEAVYTVRLVTWLSILCCLASFAAFS